MVQRFFASALSSKSYLPVGVFIAAGLGIASGVSGHSIPHADATFSFINKFELKAAAGLSSHAIESISRVFSAEAENYIPDSSVLPGKLAGFVSPSEFLENGAAAKFLLETPTLELVATSRTDFDTSAVLFTEKQRVFYHHQYMFREGSTKFGAFRDRCNASANSERVVQGINRPSLTLRAPRVLVRRVENRLIWGNLASAIPLPFGTGAQVPLRLTVKTPRASISTSPVSEDYSDYTYTCSATLEMKDSAPHANALTLNWNDKEEADFVHQIEDGQYLSKLLNAAFNGVSVEKPREQDLALKCQCRDLRLELVRAGLEGSSKAVVAVAGLLSFERFESEAACLKKAKEIPVCL
jgi:hypothetical protein